MEFKQYSEEVDLQRHWLVLKRRWLPAMGVFGIVVALSAVSTLLQKPVYEAEGKLLIRRDSTPQIIGLVNPDELKSLDVQSSALVTQAQVVQSLPVAQQVIDDLNLVDDLGNPLKPEVFLKSLVVKQVGGTDVLRIAYQSNDPEEAAAVVNRVADAYIKQNVAASRAEAAEASAYIAKQLPRTEEAVRKAEADLRRFKEQNGVIALTEEATAAVNVISTLQNQMTQAQSQLADATARTAMLQSQLGMAPEQAIAVSTLSQAPGVQEVLTELQTAQAQLTTERTRYRDRHPAIAALERRVDSLNGLLQQRVGEVLGGGDVTLGDLQIGEVERTLITDLVRAEAERSGLARRVADLSGRESAYRRQASSLPRLEQMQRELERRVEVAQTTYQTLSGRLQEVQVAENQNVGNARLISPALVPDDPAAPRKSVNLLMGGMAGLLLGIATAYALDIIDKSVKTVKEAKELLGYTLLGIIPTFSRSGKVRLGGGDTERSVPRVIARDCPYSPVGEAYQMLQANLKFLSSDKEIKSVVVTSSSPREGKSEVSANLAMAIAQVGSRVLLVDADMRQPTQHHAWDLTNTAGLSNVLVDQVDFHSAVREVAPNLHVLTAGVIPPNPVAILDSNRMASLIEAFSQEYDFIVIDTPPLAGTADAAVVGKMVDGILLVVRPGVVNSASAKSSRDYLEQSGQNVLGIVANGIDVRNEPDSYFYYSREYQTGRHTPVQLPASRQALVSGTRDRNTP